MAEAGYDVGAADPDTRDARVAGEIGRLETLTEALRSQIDRMFEQAIEDGAVEHASMYGDVCGDLVAAAKQLGRAHSKMVSGRDDADSV